MLSVKDPVETIEPVAAADAKTPAEELADRFRAFRPARLWGPLCGAPLAGVGARPPAPPPRLPA